MTVCSRPGHLKNENLFFPLDMKEQCPSGDGGGGGGASGSASGECI